ncbi:hypothetical protein MTO96_035732 [Rhipicephalus appendiculatus]
MYKDEVLVSKKRGLSSEKFGPDMVDTLPEIVGENPCLTLEQITTFRKDKMYGVEISTSAIDRLLDGHGYTVKLITRRPIGRNRTNVKEQRRKSAQRLQNEGTTVARRDMDETWTLQERSNLSIESINGLRAIQSFSKRYDRDIATMPIKSDMIKAVKQSYKRYRERMARENEQAAKRSKCDIDCSAAKPHEKQDLNAEINVAKQMLSNAEVLIAKGMKAKAFADTASGQALLNEGQARLAEALHKLEASKKVCVASHCRMLNMIHECDYFD